MQYDKTISLVNIRPSKGQNNCHASEFGPIMEITLCDAVAASAQSHFFFCFFFSSSWTVSDLETSVWEERVKEMEGEQPPGTDQGPQL